MGLKDLFKKADATPILISPAEGKLISLSEVPDKAFSSGVLGKGCAIEPSKGEIHSPCNGTITAIQDTGHAVGISSNFDADILIHVGMDTVDMAGKGFKLHVKEGHKVKAGDLLITFNIEAIKAAGHPTITPIVVNNSDDFPNFKLTAEIGNNITIGSLLMELGEK